MVDSIDTHEDVTAAFDDLAEWCAGRAPLYERLCRVAASDERIRALAARAPADRARATLLLAAVHRHLLDGTDDPLASYYPTVVDDPRQPDGKLAEAFHAFCERHADAIESTLRTRRTQTNAVGRCAVLYPAISHVADQVQGPLALVELGPSAGLNLLLDRYEYDCSASRGGVRGSPVTIESQCRQGQPPLGEPPAIHSRVGIDLHPLDVTDPDDRAWLRALVWPDQHERFQRLDAAIELARESPPPLVEGDLLADLPSVLEEIPADVPVCVFDTLVLYQVPEDVRQEVTTLLEEQAGQRPLHWLAGENEHGDHDGIALEWTRETASGVERDRLATFDPHGAWIEWEGRPAGRNDSN